MDGADNVQRARSRPSLPHYLRNPRGRAGHFYDRFGATPARSPPEPHWRDRALADLSLARARGATLGPLLDRGNSLIIIQF